jgi:hypothetical protein
VKITRHARLLLRLQGLVFGVLFTGSILLLGWLSTQYVYQADWTAGARNTVSEETRRLLGEIPDPVSITAFVRADDLLEKQIRDLVGS